MKIELSNIFFNRNKRFSYDIQADENGVVVDILYDGMCYRRVEIKVGKNLKLIVKSGEWD